MVKLFKKTFHLLSLQQTSVLSAASVIMFAVMTSRILGLFRDRLLAERFIPDELGIYYAAFRIPNMIFELLVMGALATAFIPVFTVYLDTKGKHEAFRVASSVINFGMIIFFISSLPILFFTKEISSILAPGFNPHEIDTMSSYTKIMILFQVFPFIFGNFFTGILQSFRNFLIPAIAPVVYNIGIIIGIILFSSSMGMYAPVFGVALGALLFTAIQIPFILSYGYKHIWNVSLFHPGTKEIGKLMLPRTLGLAVSQIDTTVDLILSTLLGPASVTFFNFAQHLQQLPIGIFGASIAQAALPSLSSFYAQKKDAEFKKTIVSSFLQILFFVMPVSAILIVLRIPLVRLVFGASTLFDWEATVTTGKTLAFFSISLFAQSQVHLLVRSFFALHDSKTPVIIGTFTVIANTILSILFIIYYHFDVWSLGLSASIASIVHMLLLLVFLDKKIKGLFGKELILNSLKIALAGLVTGIALYIPLKLLDQLVFDTTKTINLIMLTGISTFLGVAVYLFLTWFLDVPQTSIMYRLFQKAKSLRKGVVIDMTQEVMNVSETKI